MNKSEYRHFNAMQNRLSEMDCGYRLMAQVALPELVRPREEGTRIAREAFAALNSRRVDFAVVDRLGHLALAIEYQGHGHYGNGAFARDAIKREVVRKAGADWLEIDADDPPQRSANEMERRLRRRHSLRHS